ncbi:MAG: hypothetical protein HKN80_14045 [Acidimicrobiia bacterium]|nr:hypothetical protein [Acidimicrobiia bacterium]
MADPPANPSIEDVFNQNLEALLEERGIEHGDLLSLLEAAGYTPDTPATVLLNDAVAMAAVLGVSPAQLLTPAGDENVAVTPDLSAEGRLLNLWLRGMRPLRGDDFDAFHRGATADDLDAERVAEIWVWTERMRTAGLTLALSDAVDKQDLARVKQLSEVAAGHLNQQTLERADGRIPRSTHNGELQAAITRATRFRRQAVARRRPSTG